jgi:hypothetical protein
MVPVAPTEDPLSDTRTGEDRQRPAPAGGLLGPLTLFDGPRGRHYPGDHDPLDVSRETVRGSLRRKLSYLAGYLWAEHLTARSGLPPDHGIDRQGCRDLGAVWADTSTLGRRCRRDFAPSR